MSALLSREPNKDLLAYDRQTSGSGRGAERRGEVRAPDEKVAIREEAARHYLTDGVVA